MKTVIQNDGVIQKEALTLLGASTKRSQDGKIGMFGSGNKYALAYLLRNGYKVQIFAGLTEIKIQTVERKLAGQTFNVITIDNIETSITTDTGPQWSFWQAIREFYSNAIDEGNPSIDFFEEYELDPNKTTIIIEDGNKNLDMLEFSDNMGKYFLMDKPFAFKNKIGEIYLDDETETVAYRRGISVTDKDHYGTFLFSYNFNDIDINESRLVESEYVLERKIYSMLFNCDVPEIIQRYFRTVSSSCFEYKGFTFTTNEFPNELPKEWEQCLEGKLIAPFELAGWVDNQNLGRTIFLPTSVYKFLLTRLGESYNAIKMKGSGNFKYVDDELTHKEEFMLTQVESHFEKIKFEIPYQIKKVKSNTTFDAYYSQKSILVSKRAFEHGTFNLALHIFKIVTENEADKKEITYMDHLLQSYFNTLGDMNSAVL